LLLPPSLLHTDETEVTREVLHKLEDGKSVYLEYDPAASKGGTRTHPSPVAAAVATMDSAQMAAVAKRAATVGTRTTYLEVQTLMPSQ